MRNKQSGFTLIELLVTIAILALLIIISLMSWQKNLNQARDAHRKSDLEKIRIAFENYYNDNGCFPEEAILQICDGDDLGPYLSNIPCDPVYSLPYCYIHDPDNACGQSYKILAPLKATDDPIIEKILCSGDLYCGYEETCDSLISPPSGSDYGGFNYGVSSGNIQVYNPDAISPEPSPSPSPSGSPIMDGSFACSSTDGGRCNSYADPIEAGCPVTFYNNDCDNSCSDPATWCAS